MLVGPYVAAVNKERLNISSGKADSLNGVSSELILSVAIAWIDGEYHRASRPAQLFSAPYTVRSCADKPTRLLLSSQRVVVPDDDRIPPPSLAANVSQQAHDPLLSARVILVQFPAHERQRERGAEPQVVPDFFRDDSELLGSITWRDLSRGHRSRRQAWCRGTCARRRSARCGSASRVSHATSSARGW